MTTAKIITLAIAAMAIFSACTKDKDAETDPPAEPTQATPGAKTGSIQIFPSDNSWNKDISAEPVDPNSDKLIASIGNNVNLHPDFGTVWEKKPIGIPYNVIGPNQAKVKVTFHYASESDAGPDPIPANALVEAGSDKHVIVLDTANHKLYELYNATRNGDNSWKAGSGAIYDLTSNKLRQDYFTSADAAGLPIFPGLVRYEEVVTKKQINHALRFTVQNSRNAFVHPATHGASESYDINLPPMGMRVRLKSNFDISRFTPNIQVILKAMKKYGMFVADNGSNWYISGSPDSRWSDDELNQIKTIKGSNFEVVKMGTVVNMPED
ncbi:MAG TPA: hypothetical protein VHO72_14425 [Bacteroidales bacterium]|nr:hypothetical protein [Bacteroidales bacterium]